MSRSHAGPVGLSPAQTLGFAAAYVALALAGRATAVSGASVSLVWPAAGVAVLWLLAEQPHRQVRVLAMLAAALAVVLALTGAATPLVVVGVLAVVAQTWLIVVLLRRWCPSLLGAGGEVSVHTFRTLAVGTGIALLACFVGAAIVTAGLWWAGDPPSVAGALLVWGRQVAGTLVVGSVGHLGWEWVSGRAGARVRGGGRAELVVLTLASLASLVAVFTQPLPLVFLIVPFSIWSASRFTTFVAVVHATVVGSLALVLTINGRGPLADLGDPYERAMVTQVFLLTLLLTALAVGTLRDRVDGLVSELTSAHERSDEQAELLSGMTESMGEGLVVLDREGRVTTHNAASVRLARRHLQADDAVALAALVGLLGRASTQDGRRAELGPGDVVVPLADGGEMILAVTSRPLSSGGVRAGHFGTVLVLREVTAHRSGFKPLVDFAHTAAHDLRVPLTAMRTWLSLVEVDPDVLAREDLRGPIERVGRSLVKMGDLIEDLLAHATAEGGVLAPEHLDVFGEAGVLAQVVELTGAREVVTVGTDLPAVHADPVAVRQLFANLIGNAVKYASGGGQRIEVSAVQHGDRVVFDVRDHGPGVAEEDRERIFERFHRSRHGRASSTGTGLGLSLCRTIVERHGGRITCLAPAEGDGAVFRFDLPAAAPRSR